MNKELLLIPTIYHYHQIKNQITDWSRFILLTYDFNVGSQISEHGPVHYVQSYITESEINAVTDQGLELMYEWQDWLKGDFIHRGIDLVEMALFDHRRALIACLKMNLVIPRIISALKPSRLMLFNEFFKPDFNGLPHTYYPDIIHSIFAWHARQNNIPMSLIPGVDFTDDHSALIHNIIQENSLHFQTLNFEKYLPKLKTTKMYEPDKYNRTIFLVGYFMEMFDQALLFQQLSADPETLFIFICLQNTPLFQNNLSSLLIDFRYIKLWPFNLDNLYQKIDNHHARFSSNEFSIQKKYPYLFQNRFLDFQFKFFYDTLKDCARTIEGMSLLIDTYHPSLLLAGGSSQMSAVRSAIEVGNQFQIPTLGLMHGGLWADYLFTYMPFPFHYFGVRGDKYHKKVTEKSPFKTETHTVGDLRQHMQNQKPSQDIENYLKTIFSEEDKKPVILLITNGFDVGMSEIISNPTQHEKTWEKILEIAGRRSDLKFLIKPHPGYDYYHFYEKISKLGSSIVLLQRQIPVTAILPKINLGICINNFSSTILEAAHIGKPFLYLRDAVYKTSRYNNEELVDKKCLLVESVNELENRIDLIINQPEYLNENLEAGAILLNEFTTNTGELALEKANQLIQNLTNLVKKTSTEIDNTNSNLGHYLISLAHHCSTWQLNGDSNALQSHIAHLAQLDLNASERNTVEYYLNAITHLAGG